MLEYQGGATDQYKMRWRNEVGREGAEEGRARRKERQRGRVGRERETLLITFRAAILACQNGKSLQGPKKGLSDEEMDDRVILNPGLTFLSPGELVTSTTAQASLRPTESEYLGLGPGRQAF